MTIAADTGAVDHVINRSELARGCNPDGIVGRDLVGACNEHIESYGGCDRLLSTNKCEFACQWQVADVGRAFHSISKTTGPVDGPGLNDVLFNNRVGVVMPAGIVDKLLEKIMPMLTDERRGGL